MKKVRLISIATLIFLGITSVTGAVPLIADPSGNLLKMPLSLLECSPFTSYLIPGIILLVANGLLSFVVLVFVLRRVNRYGWWIVLQGCVIAGWITAQVLMIRMVIWAHFVYWAAGLVLIMCGWILRNEQPRASSD